MAETKNDDDIHVDEFEDQQNFVPPAQKSVKEILNADANDESLKKLVFSSFLFNTPIF